jgi:hypothetical protein
LTAKPHYPVQSVKAQSYPQNSPQDEVTFEEISLTLVNSGSSFA